MKIQKTTTVTVFGILNIAFAVLGIISVIGMLALFAVVGDTSKNPVLQLIHDSPAYAIWMKTSMVVGLLMAGLLLTAGIGLLQCQRWARVLSISYAIYSIIMLVVSTVVNFFFMVLPLLHQAQSKSGPEQAGAIGGAIGGTVGGCFGLIYPVLLLIFMLRTKPVEPPAGQA